MLYYTLLYAILYVVVDYYLFSSKLYWYEDVYNYYDINVNNILPYKKRDNEYVIRYTDVNRSSFAPLQLKIKNFSGKIEILTNDNKVMFIHSDDKELFEKCREIWYSITELIGINNAPNFVKTTSNDDEFIIADVHESTSFVEGNYENKLVLVLYSVFNDH